MLSHSATTNKQTGGQEVMRELPTFSELENVIITEHWDVVDATG
jgi:predicted SnoaL-like aldol condensation-catalyzing enzyme